MINLACFPSLLAFSLRLSCPATAAHHTHCANRSSDDYYYNYESYEPDLLATPMSSVDADTGDDHATSNESCHDDPRSHPRSGSLGFDESAESQTPTTTVAMTASLASSQTHPRASSDAEGDDSNAAVALYDAPKAETCLDDAELYLSTPEAAVLLLTLFVGLFVGFKLGSWWAFGNAAYTKCWIPESIGGGRAVKAHLRSDCGWLNSAPTYRVDVCRPCYQSVPVEMQTSRVVTD